MAAPEAARAPRAEDRVRRRACALVGLLGGLGAAARLSGPSAAFSGALQPLPVATSAPLPGAALRGAAAAAPAVARTPASSAPPSQGAGLAPAGALLAAGACIALALCRSDSRSLVTMFGKADRRTFRGKLHGHSFGKYRMRKTKARRLRDIKRGTFDPSKVVQRGQPEPEHCWDVPAMLQNKLYSGNMPQWYLDLHQNVEEGVTEAMRQDYERRMGKFGKQHYFKDWSPPALGGGGAPAEVAACLVGEKVKVSAKMVKDLRERSRAGILDCQKALKENDGDMDKAMDWLRKKGIAKADKKAGNIAVEGNVASYVHFNSKLAVMVEVNSETDFVASNAIFKEFASDVAMQIAANPSIVCVTSDDVPEEVKSKEKALEMAKEDLEGKPENIKEKIVVGRLKKKYEEMSLMKQKWLKEDEKTVEEVLKERIAKLGENLVIRRFVRLNLGEGLEKKDDDFAAGVEKELAKYRSGAEEAEKPKEEKPKEEPKEEAKPKAEEKPKEAPAVEGPPITAVMVKELRGRSGAGILDSKKALSACAGDIDKAMDWLKKKGMAKADKKAGNLSAEGAIASYVHFNNKLGVIVEVNSETDFVAINAIFKEFAKDVAMQIAANPSVVCISADEVPEDVKAKEKEIEMSKEDLAGKPDNIKEKIVVGRLKKKYEEMALLNQKWLKDEDKTVQEVLKERIAKLGENLVIRRFERLVLGEGLEKKEDDFAAGVEKELAKYRS